LRFVDEIDKRYGEIGVAQAVTFA